MIHNNIIHPLKHPYISPKVEFEEMEGDGMMQQATGSATGSDGTKGDDTEDPNGDIPEAKSATFIWDEDTEYTIE